VPSTGNRWAKGSKSPADFTGKQGIEIREKLLADQQAREEAASIDIPALKRDEYLRGFDAGWDSATTWITEKMTEAGLDPDILVVGTDEPDDEGQVA
jgi:hypothetical protein